MDSLKSPPSFFGGLKVLEEPAESRPKFRDHLVRQDTVAGRASAAMVVGTGSGSIDSRGDHRTGALESG